MTIDFTNLLQRFYPSQESSQNDSYATNLLVKAIAKLNLLVKYRANFDSLTPQLFSELESNIRREKNDDPRLPGAKLNVDKFFSYYTPLVKANEILSSSLLDLNETLWIEKESPAILEFLKMIQGKCSAHLAQFPDASIENQRKTIMGHIQQVQFKAHFPMPSPAAIEVPTAEPAALESEELLPLSSSFQKLCKKQEQLKDLELEAEKLFVALKAWKEAKEKGQKTDLPNLEHFEKVRAMINEISREELNFPPNLLKKVAMCSAAAGRALEQIAEQTQKINDQILERKNTLKSHFLEHLSDYSIWKVSKGMNGRIPSFGDVIQHFKTDPNPELSTVALLGSVDWLNNLPETKMENLKQAFLNLSPVERNQLENLLKASASPEEFFPKLSQYYEGRVKAVEEKTRKDNQSLDTLRQELHHEMKIKESMLATLAEEKDVLASEKAELAAEIQTLRQNLSKVDEQHAKAKEEAARKIKDLESNCQNLQKELESASESGKALEETNKKVAILAAKKINLTMQLTALKEATQRQHSDAKQTIDTLQTQLEEQTKAFLEAKSKKADLENQIVELRSQNKLKLADAHGKLIKLQVDLKEQQGLVTTLERGKEALEIKIQDLTEQYKEEYAEAQSKIKSLIEEISREAGEAARLKREKLDLEDRIRDLTKESSNAQEDSDALKDELKMVEEILAKLNSHYTETEDQIKELQATYNAGGNGDWQWLEHLKGILKLHGEQVRQVKLEKTNRENQIRELSELLDRNQSEIPDLQSKLKKLEDELAQQKALVADLEADKQSGMQQLRDLKSHFERECATTQNKLAELQQELEQQKSLLITSEKEKAVLAAKVNELTEQLQEVESRLQSQPRKIPKQTRDMPAGMNLLERLNYILSDETKTEPKGSIQSSDLLDRLKGLHSETDESKINWAVISVMIRLLAFRISDELSFELLNIFIKLNVVEQEIKELETNLEQFMNSRPHFKNVSEYIDCQKKYNQPIAEKRKILVNLETLQKFFSAVLIDEISELYKVLNREIPLLDPKNPVKFCVENNQIKGIIFCREGVDFWDKCGFFCPNDAIEHMFLCLNDNHCKGNLPVKFEFKGIPLEKATDIYLDVAQILESPSGKDFDANLASIKKEIREFEKK